MESRKLEDASLRYQTELLELEEENCRLRQLAEEKIARILTAHSTATATNKDDDVVNKSEPPLIFDGSRYSHESQRREDASSSSRRLKEFTTRFGSTKEIKYSTNPTLTVEKERPSSPGLVYFRAYKNPTTGLQMRVKPLTHYSNIGDTPISLSREDNVLNMLSDECVPSERPGLQSPPTSNLFKFRTPKVSVQDHNTQFLRYYKATADHDEVPSIPSIDR